MPGAPGRRVGSPGTKRLTARSPRCGHIEVDRVAEDGAPAGIVMVECPLKVRVRSEPGTMSARVPEGNMRRTDGQRIGPEGGQIHPHLIAADTGVHDLTQSLVVEAGI